MSGRKMRGLRKSRVRRAAAIRGYVGANGGGKTMCAVVDLLPSLERGRRVLSNVRILDYQNPRPCDDPECKIEGHPDHQAAHPLYEALTDFRQMLEFKGGEILLDEIASVASSREFGALPFQVTSQLQQLRRRDVTLSWTAPGWLRADKVLREVTQLVTECRGSMPVQRVGDDRIWRDNRLFVWRSYDATTFEEFTAGKRDKLKPMPRGLFWRPRSLAEIAYDTLDTVTGVGWANEAGICMNCGGRRSIPRCHCAPGAEGSDDGAAVVHLSAPARRSTREERRNQVG